MEQYCENCQVIEIRPDDKYCDECLEDILVDMYATEQAEQQATEKGLY